MFTNSGVACRLLFVFAAVVQGTVIGTSVTNYELNRQEKLKDEPVQNQVQSNEFSTNDSLKVFKVAR